MAYWDRIDELKRRYLESKKDPAAREEWETAVKEEIAEKDRWIDAWDHANIHQLRAIWRASQKLTIYSKQEGLQCASVFVDSKPLPSEPISEELRGIVLAIDKQGNWSMNDKAQSIAYAPDHLQLHGTKKYNCF